jgi:hypothetical protein
LRRARRDDSFGLVKPQLREASGAKWGWIVLACVWLLLGLLAVYETVGVRDYVALLDDSSTLPTDSLPLRRSVPNEFADAHTWTRYAIAVEAGAPWQVRWTDIDNAPTGREVHWNSVLVHLIAAAGRVRSLFLGEPLATATENALAWLNLPIFLATVIVFSSWIAVRAGPPAGALAALAMGGYRWFYDGFAPNYVDHHGLVTAACFGVVLGCAFMGAGWRRNGTTSGSLLPSSRREARMAAIASGVAGGLGLWVSAASVIPTIAAVGVAATCVALWLGPRAIRDGHELDAGLWRLWGRVGAATAFVGYLVEYAPSHLGMHLEVNHPLYALAWLGGAELVAHTMEWRVSGGRVAWWRFSLATVALLAPALVIAVRGSAVFAPLDPRVRLFHAGIEEFYSLPGLLRVRGATASRFVAGFLLLVPAGLIGRSTQRDRLLLAFAAIVSVPLVILACVQVRWWLMASGAELTLLVVAFTSLTSARTTRTQWLASLAIGALFVEQFAARAHSWHANVSDRVVSAEDALQPVYRDAAVVIRASQPRGPIVLLASPNASMGIGYYGRFQTLASLYWENRSGMEAAAAIFSASSDDSALALAQARGVTHVAVVSPSDFLQHYLDVNRAGASPSDLSRTLGERLLRGARVRWLKPIPFRPRLPDPRDKALLFQVDASQTDFEADWNAAIAAVARGASNEADSAFESAVARVAPTRKAELYQNAGMAAYTWSDHALAVRLLRASMAARPTAGTAVNLGWILATSADDRVRNGPEALAIATSLGGDKSQDPAVLDLFAAALAETGRFADAATVAEGLAARAQRAGDAAGAARARQRLSAYRAGRAWRQ